MRDRGQGSTKTLSAPHGTKTTHLGHPIAIRRQPPYPTNSRNDVTSPQGSSVELEGERGRYASCEAIPTGGDTDTSGALDGDEDARKRPKKLRNELQQDREHSNKQ